MENIKLKVTNFRNLGVKEFQHVNSGICREKVLQFVLEKFKSKLPVDATLKDLICNWNLSTFPLHTMILQTVLFRMNSMYMLDVTVVGLLGDLQSRIYIINLEQNNQPHHHQALPHHPNQVPRMQPHHQEYVFKRSIVSDSRYIILQGTKTKTNLKCLIFLIFNRKKHLNVILIIGQRSWSSRLCISK